MDIATTVTSMTDKLVCPIAGAPLTMGPVYGAELGALLTLGPAEGSGQWATGNGLEDPGDSLVGRVKALARVIVRKLFTKRVKLVVFLIRAKRDLMRWTLAIDSYIIESYYLLHWVFDSEGCARLATPDERDIQISIQQSADDQEMLPGIPSHAGGSRTQLEGTKRNNPPTKETKWRAAHISASNHTARRMYKPTEASISLACATAYPLPASPDRILLLYNAAPLKYCYRPWDTT
jgi:hypothetical protein